MLRYSFYWIGVTVLILLAGSQAVADGQLNPVDLKAFYASCIEDAIVKCECKMNMRDSKFETIRRAAALALLKSAYLREYKTHLIEEMQRNQINPQVHRVHYYINHKFFEVMR